MLTFFLRGGRPSLDMVLVPTVTRDEQNVRRARGEGEVTESSPVVAMVAIISFLPQERTAHMQFFVDEGFDIKDVIIT